MFVKIVRMGYAIHGRGILIRLGKQAVFKPSQMILDTFVQSLLQNPCAVQQNRVGF
jgi:hypothetical protein